MGLAPRRSIIGGVLFLALTLCNFSMAEAAAVDIPIDKLAGEIRKSVEDASAYYKQKSAQERHDSVGRLSGDIIKLAAAEMGLSGVLKGWQSSSSNSIEPAPDADKRVILLKAQLETIRDDFMAIQRDLAILDPDFQKRNPLVLIDVGSFAHDGIIFYCPPNSDCHVLPDGHGVIGSAAVVFSNPKQFQSFVAVLDSDSAKLRTFADEIAKSS
jgi:hypothetical protein